MASLPDDMPLSLCSCLDTTFGVGAFSRSLLITRDWDRTAEDVEKRRPACVVFNLVTETTSREKISWARRPSLVAAMAESFSQLAPGELVFGICAAQYRRAEIVVSPCYRNIREWWLWALSSMAPVIQWWIFVAWAGQQAAAERNQKIVSQGA